MISLEHKRKVLEVLDSTQKVIDYVSEKVFCPTGEGGGVDASCSPDEAGSGSSEESKSKYKPANPDGADTYEQYRTSDGSWTEERQKLHSNIIDKALKESKATPVENPISYVMGGGPASGKSAIIRAGMVSIPDNHVKIDADEVKQEIPEYVERTKNNDPSAAAFAHEESSYVSKEINKEAEKKKLNTLLDGTGNSSYEKLKSKVTKMKAAGRKVVANYVTVSLEEAQKRNIARAKKTGRLVPKAFLESAHRSVSQIVPKAIKEGLFDDFSLYDTGQGGDPVKVASAVGDKLEIHDEKLWNDFLKKGG